MIKNVLLTLLVLFVSLGQFVLGQAPMKLKVGLYIRSLSINNKEKHAIIDLYYWYKFKLPKDTSDLKSYYQLEVTNGDLIFNEIQEERMIKDTFYISGHMKGNFQFDANYVNYPFDKQKLMIQFEHPFFTKEEVVLVPDEASYKKCKIRKEFWGLSDSLQADGLYAHKSEFVEGSRVYETDFGDPEIEETESSYSNISFFIYVSRDAVPYTLKFMLPLIIILCLAYLVFYIPADALDLAAGLTVTSLLAGIAFQWTISDDLPGVGYLTCVDRIFYLSYSLIMVAMVQTIWTYHLDKNGNVKLADALEIGGRWLFPILFFGGTTYFIISASMN